jgi:alkylation response protein AidB-like acyl-CoA dehydrogenase
MSDDDRAIQERARSFVDTELIPHEVEAELHGGRLSDDLRERHHRMAIELGLWAMNMPKELGGGGPVDVPAGAGLRAARPGDQRARLVRAHAAAWAPRS